MGHSKMNFQNELLQELVSRPCGVSGFFRRLRGPGVSATGPAPPSYSPGLAPSPPMLLGPALPRPRPALSALRHAPGHAHFHAPSTLSLSRHVPGPAPHTVSPPPAVHPAGAPPPTTPHPLLLPHRPLLALSRKPGKVDFRRTALAAAAAVSPPPPGPGLSGRAPVGSS